MGKKSREEMRGRDEQVKYLMEQRSAIVERRVRLAEEQLEKRHQDGLGVKIQGRRQEGQA